MQVLCSMEDVESQKRDGDVETAADYVLHINV